jgi:Arc/MetJ family transcription regulator
MIKRTSMNLDVELVAAAKEVLGTSETTETVNRALAEVVRQEKIRRLLSRRFDLAPEERDWLRKPTGEIRPGPVGAR